MEPVAMPLPQYKRYDEIVDRLTKDAEKSGAENVAVEPSGVEETVAGAVSKAASPAGAASSRREVEPLQDDKQCKKPDTTTDERLKNIQAAFVEQGLRAMEELQIRAGQMKLTGEYEYVLR